MATREEIRDGIATNVEGANYTGLLWHFPMTIPMPCGKVYHYAHPEVFPLEDTPCDCGDPNHWVIRYELDEEPIAEPELEQSPKCTACEGRGFIEHEHGLIQVECEVCKGTGIIEIKDGDSFTAIHTFAPEMEDGAEPTPPVIIGKISVKEFAPFSEENASINRTQFLTKEADSIMEIPAEAPETQRSPNLGEYFCSKCNSIHRETSRVGKKHLKYNDNRSDSRTESANQSA